jgi:hypothetical protein
VGFFDALLGGKKKLRGVAPDRLFAMTTAYVTMEIELGMKSTGAAGIAFQSLETSDFEGILRDAQELLAGTAQETGTELESSVEDIVVSLNTLSTELQGGGYGDRLLAAVFAFDYTDSSDSASMPNPSRQQKVYFIYNFKRGAFYPFVPSGGSKQRDTPRELRLKAQLQNEIPFEEDTTRWFPLWEIPL